MSISATEAVTPGGFATGVPTTGQSEVSEDKQMFLELLVAQLRYQDPLKPADSGEFLAQSAQFTALEKMQEVADRTGALLGAQMAFGASGLVGRHVSYLTPDGETHSGTVDGVTFGAEGPMFDVGGTEVPLNNITQVTALPQTASQSGPEPADPDSAAASDSSENSSTTP